jgi:hypothetical protein
MTLQCRQAQYGAYTEPSGVIGIRQRVQFGVSRSSMRRSFPYVWIRVASYPHQCGHFTATIEGGLLKIPIRYSDLP